MVGVVRDQANAIALPGTPVEVVGTDRVVYTDVDGRYILDLPPGRHQLKVVLDGYNEKIINVDAGAVRTMTLDVGLTMARSGGRSRPGLSDPRLANIRRRTWSVRHAGYRGVGVRVSVKLFDPATRLGSGRSIRWPA